ESLKRKEIMVRKNSVQVDYYSVHLWASSLEELITNKINQTFLCYQSEKKLPDYYLHIDVLNFEEVETSNSPIAYVKYVVQFLNPGNMEVLAQKIYSIEKESTSKGVPELVKTFSSCVDEIINKIYADARNINKPE
ncbi:MAG: ABC-type transport auxiliary lipoprotein family protein, partial [Candidatus Hydrogenedens sp.]